MGDFNTKVQVHRIFVGMQDNSGNHYFQYELEEILNKYFEGYCLTEGRGYYKGKQEKCYIVDLFDALLGYKVIAEIKSRLNQECVLVQTWEVDGGFE